jgi:hypothetical protein
MTTPEGQGQTQAVIEDDRPVFPYVFRSCNRPAGDPLAREVEVMAPSYADAVRLAAEEHEFDIDKENAGILPHDLPVGCPEQVAIEEARKARVQPQIDALKSKLASTGVDVSTIPEEVFEAFVQLGQEALSSFRAGGMQFVPNGPSGMPQAFGGMPAPGGFPSMVDVAGVLGGMGAAAPRGPFPSPHETFSLGGPGGFANVADNSAFGYMVRLANERRRKIQLFRDVLAGGAFAIAEYLSPPPHPFGADPLHAFGALIGGLQAPQPLSDWQAAPVIPPARGEGF